MKEVFQRVEEENDRLQKLEIESEKESTPETELKGEGPPPVPKRDFEKDPNGKPSSITYPHPKVILIHYLNPYPLVQMPHKPNIKNYPFSAENDSGVSSGGENHNENSISTPLQVH